MDKPILEARGLVRAYREGAADTRVLGGVDLAVGPGEFVAILGPSGSGKSTLLNLLGLLDAPSAGEVLIDGRPAASLPEEERCRVRNARLGFVFQFDSLLHEFTVLENVTLPGRIAAARTGGSIAELEERAARQLEALGIGRLAHRMPQQLSGGERQRAAIARALLNRPAALLADEPTGNLDRRNGELVFSTLKQQSETSRVAVVLVTHNEEVARYATRVVHLLDGRLEAEIRS